MASITILFHLTCVYLRLDEALIALNELCASFKGYDVLSVEQQMNIQAWLVGTPGMASVFLRSPRALQLRHVDINKNIGI